MRSVDTPTGSTPPGEPGLLALAAIGPFFGVGTRDDGPGWRPLGDLVTGPALDERVGHVAAVLARMAGTEAEPRVAASTLSLGLFARLLSPVLGATTLGIALPRPTLENGWWRPVASGPWPLALVGPPTSPDLDALLDDVVQPLSAAICGRYSLSGLVVWGNVASALFGAVRMIGVARPELLNRAQDRAARLLEGPLAGTGTVGDRFVRSSCCLYYRVPGGGYCGDCVLAGH